MVGRRSVHDIGRHQNGATVHRHLPVTAALAGTRVNNGHGLVLGQHAAQHTVKRRHADAVMVLDRQELDVIRTAQRLHHLEGPPDRYRATSGRRARDADSHQVHGKVDFLRLDVSDKDRLAIIHDWPTRTP